MHPNNIHNASQRICVFHMIHREKIKYFRINHYFVLYCNWSGESLTDYKSHFNLKPKEVIQWLKRIVAKVVRKGPGLFRRHSVSVMWWEKCSTVIGDTVSTCLSVCLPLIKNWKPHVFLGDLLLCSGSYMLLLRY